MPHQRRVIVSVDAAGPGEMDQVVAGLEEAGLHIESVLDALCTVTGTCIDVPVDTLQSVPGVLDVETQREFQLPPEDEPQ